MNKSLFECRTKATMREGDRLRFALNWAVARRTRLVLTESEFVCGEWLIPYREVEDAVLVEIPTLFGRARNLVVYRRGGMTYQFALRPQSSWRFVFDPFWDGPLPLPIRREVRHLGFRGDA